MKIMMYSLPLIFFPYTLPYDDPYAVPHPHAHPYLHAFPQAPSYPSFNANPYGCP